MVETGQMQGFTAGKLAESTSRFRDELLHLLIEKAPASLAMIELAISDYGFEIHEFDWRNLIGRTQYQVLSDLHTNWNSTYRRAFDGELCASGKESFNRPDASVRWLHRTSRPWFMIAGETGETTILADDLATQEHPGLQLRLAAKDISDAREDIAIAAANGFAFDIDDTFTRISGNFREAVLWRNRRRLRPGIPSAGFYRNLWSSPLEDGEWTGEVRNHTKGGKIHFGMPTNSEFRDQTGRALAAESQVVDTNQLKDEHREHDAFAEGLRLSADRPRCYGNQTGKIWYQNSSPLQDFSVHSENESPEYVREALANCQVVLHYQPKVNMRTGEVAGLEALLRLQHPERGLLSPAAFMSAIEDRYLAIEIGEWVIDQALLQMEIWKAGGLNLPVSVNVSGFHLLRSDFAGRLRALLATHPLVGPSGLELEVRESSAHLNLAKTSEALKACRQLGVSIALDDFGAGFCSPSDVEQLPVDVLKIDRSFVIGMMDDLEDLGTVESVLSLAKTFGRQVIAEGVESADYGVMLLQLNCELAQGYGIAAPMPASDLPAWVAAWRPDPRWAHVRSLHHGNRSLIYANVEHRALLAGLESALEGKCYSPLPTDLHECHLYKWLESKAHTRYRAVWAVDAIEAIHRRFHTMAEEILASHSLGHKSDSMARIDETRSLHDELLKQLEPITSMPAGNFQEAT